MSAVMEELKELSNGLKSAWEDFKAEHTQALETAKSENGELRAEAQQALERINARLDEHVDDVNTRLQKLNLTAANAGDGPSEARQAFSAFVRTGKLSPEQAALLKRTDGSGNILPASVMTVSDDTEGGWLAPDDVADEIIKGVVEYSPIREIAYVRKTIRNSVKAPKRTQTTGAVWVGEVEARSETQGLKFGKEEIGTREMSAMSDISRQDLEDSGYDLEGAVYEDFGEQFGVTEGLGFVSGDGVDGKPEGFLTAADTGYLGAEGVYTRTSVTNDALSADDIITLYFDLKTRYARNSTFVLNRATVKDVRLLKDQNDQYLWQPGLAGTPPTIYDRPYVEAPDMPTVANGALVIALADWKRFYWIVDRLAIETLRDPYTQAGTGTIRFWARKRVGGQVVLPEAGKLLEIQ